MKERSIDKIREELAWIKRRYQAEVEETRTTRTIEEKNKAALEYALYRETLLNELKRKL